MLYHAAICVNDVERAVRFYDSVLATVGLKRVMDFMPMAVAYGTTRGEFWIQSPKHMPFLAPSQGAHFGFTAKDEAAVTAFHEAALAQGGASVMAPKLYPEFGPNYFGCVVRDLDGHLPEVLVYPRT